MRMERDILKFPTELTKVECPECKGDGEIYVGLIPKTGDSHLECLVCKGTGLVTRGEELDYKKFLKVWDSSLWVGFGLGFLTYY